MPISFLFFKLTNLKMKFPSETEKNLIFFRILGKGFEIGIIFFPLYLCEKTTFALLKF